MADDLSQRPRPGDNSVQLDAEKWWLAERGGELRDSVAKWRRRGSSWPAIAKMITEATGLHVSRYAVSRWYGDIKRSV